MSIRTFSPLPVRSVVQGRGAVEQLPQLLDRLGIQRALLITGRSLAKRTDFVARLRLLLGDRLAGVYGSISQHTPSSQVVEAAEQARRFEVDGLISLGGGSPIDGTKAIAYALSRGMATREQLLGRAPGGPTHPALAHIALPTTLSAAECAYAAGITDENTQMKTGISAPELAPAGVVYDPELTLHTPSWLWGATGMRAIDHAVETIYSPDHQPLTDVLAQEALRLLFAHLPATVGQQWSVVGGRWSVASQATSNLSVDEALARRLVCQQAAWFSFFGAPSIRMGMSHALGRRIGAHFEVPHGYTSALTLPQVMRRKADEAPDRLRLVAQAVGVDSPELNDRQAAERAADAVAELVSRLKLPSRLREVGIKESDLDWIADGRPEVVELLRGAF